MKTFALVIIIIGFCLSLIIYFNKEYKYRDYVVIEKSTENKTYKINLNLVSAKELDNLPGIGPKLAQRIIEDRRKHGRFNSSEDLMRVKGINAKKFDELKKYLI